MKYFWIFTLNIWFTGLLVNKGLAQSDTLRLYQAYPSFSNSEKAEWTSFENNWNYFDYSAIQKKLKVSKLNCKNCESLYADVYVQIDSLGKFSVIHFLRGKKCGVWCEEELFINLFENSLKRHQLNSLKNKEFIVRFGHILKC
ncbi:MAG: hypothetical protein K0S26_746 [Bacteroidota bacterium]|jgi:hypothetical protein|nr:hypothetical protein [Bacteroidota bacterium]